MTTTAANPERSAAMSLPAPIQRGLAGLRGRMRRLDAGYGVTRSVIACTAFVACTFRRTSFFGATLEGCKLTGSSFVYCTLRPLTVRGGQWRAVVAFVATTSGPRA